MNILVLTPLVPFPPHDGDRLRLYHFLRYLKGRGHVIDLFCLTRHRADLENANTVRPLCRSLYVEYLSNADLFFNLIGGILMGQSLNVSGYFSPHLREALKDYWKTNEGKNTDVVLAHRLRMAPAAFEGSPQKPVVLELTDCLAAYMERLKGQKGVRWSRRLAAWWDYWFLKTEELDWIQASHKTTVISPLDAQVLLENGAAFDKLEILPNGITRNQPGKNKPPAIYPGEKPVVCFVGSMEYAANEDGALWFLKGIWPLVKQKVPGAVFAVVGKAPRKVLSRWHNHQDVFVTGWVPEVDSYLMNADVSVAPLRVAAGMQNKVAHSMSLGIPVVATPSAVKWMPLHVREEMFIAEDEETFAQAVVEVLLKSHKYRIRAEKAKNLIIRNFKWEESGRKLESLLKDAARNSKSKIEF